jgi:hypothetical protein
MAAFIGIVLIVIGGGSLWLAYGIVRRVTGGGRDSSAGALGCATWSIAGPIAAVGLLLLFVGITIFR